MTGIAAFQPHGIVVGATGARAKRDALPVSVAVHAPLRVVLLRAMGRHGVRLAMQAVPLGRTVTPPEGYPAPERQVAAAAMPHGARPDHA